MKKLSDILSAGAGSGQDFGDIWNSTDAAGDFAPLPAGQYICRIESGELDTSSRGTMGYKLTFVVIEGPKKGTEGETDSAGRKLWHDLWLTPAALPMAKRDLAKLGITDPEQMEEPLPLGIRCRVQVALRRDDDGTERNRVKRFEVIGIDTPEPEAFAPLPTDSPADDTADDDAIPDTTPDAQQSLELEGGGNVPF